MTELYQFLRYYLPGSLLLMYIGLFIIHVLAPATFDIGLDKILAVFVGLLAANYAVGYLVYVPFVYKYEKMAMNSEKRPALGYILRLAKEEECENYLRCDTQKKEFLDLAYHSNYESASELRIHPEIIATLKNNLSNYAARYVCGTYVPLAVIPGIILTIPTLAFVEISFELKNVWFIFVALTAVLSISLLLSMDRERVLNETFALEEFMIRTKQKEVRELLKRLRFSEVRNCQRRMSDF